MMTGRKSATCRRARAAPPPAAAAATTDGGIRLPDDLLEARAWPPGSGEIGLVETHISWVFLVGDCAYKFKKPVRLPFLDFSTPQLRRHFCEEELRINSRFSPELYLGLSQVVATPSGAAVDRPGEVVEYAVRMRRFARGDELDRLLAAGAADHRLLYRFGRRLARLHQALPVAAAGHPHADPARTFAACEENFSTLRQLSEPALRERVTRIERWTAAEYARLEPIMRARLETGHYRECHGDLHCANVARYSGALHAFDALEFDPGLRWIDTASDLAFLLMDLAVRGRPDLAAVTLDGWLTGSGDYGALDVLRFHTAYRAGVRAKVSAIRASQDPDSAGAALHELAVYLDAALALTAPPFPRLIITTGLSGSGKSWLASRLLAPLGAVRVRSDVERKRLAGLDPDLPSDGSIYTPAHTRDTYGQLEQVAARALRAGYPVIVDAAFLLERERRRFRDLAHRLGAPFVILATAAEREMLEERLTRRATTGGDPSEATPAVLAMQVGFAEPLSSEEHAVAVIVDTAAAIDLPAVAAAVNRVESN